MIMYEHVICTSVQLFTYTQVHIQVQATYLLLSIISLDNEAIIDYRN